MAEEIKRGRTDGFDGVKGDATRKRLNLMLNKNKVKGDWRKQKVVTISCTIMLQKWIYKLTWAGVSANDTQNQPEVGGTAAHYVSDHVLYRTD